MQQSTSFKIAIEHGFRFDDTNHLRPPRDSDFAEKLGHSRDHNAQTYIYPANKLDAHAGICGGTEFTLEQLAKALGVNLETPSRNGESVDAWWVSRSPHFFGWYEKNKQYLNYSIYFGDYGVSRAVYFRLNSGQYIAYTLDHRTFCGKGDKAPSKAPEIYTYHDNLATQEEPWVLCDSPKDIPAYSMAGFHKVAATYAAGKLSRVQMSTLIAKSGYKFLIVTDATTDERRANQKMGELIKRHGGSVKYYDFEPGSESGIDATDVLNRHGIEEIKRIYPGRMDKIYDLPEKKSPSAEKKSSPPRETTPTDVLSDITNANELWKRYGDILHYCYEKKRWLVWDGRRWQWDRGNLITELAKKTVIECGVQAFRNQDQRAIAWYNSSQNRNRIQSMIALTQSIEGIPIKLSELDRNPLLLNVRNGTFDAETGNLRPHSKTDLITKYIDIPYMEGNFSPLWENTVKAIAGGDPELLHFLQRLTGYCATGSTKHQCFFIFYGSGSNGKSTFLKAINRVLGEYQQSSNLDTFLTKKYGANSSHQEDLARLAGARMVTAIESDFGKSLSESLIKKLTGQDTITASMKFENSFEFEPEFKLVLAVNHKPIIRGRDNAIWRRVVMVPFLQEFTGTQKDGDLGEKLLHEGESILNWIIEGVKNWKKSGLNLPNSVQNFTQEFREESDNLGDFVNSCVLGKNERAPAKLLYDYYLSWCKDNAEEAFSMRVFGKMLCERGYEKGRDMKSVYYSGLSVPNQTLFETYDDSM